MRRPLVFAALIALLLPLDSSALGYKKFRLDNGLKVILHRTSAPGLVDVYVWYKVGSFDEPPGRSGFAHFFEHYLFKDTRHFKGDAIEKFVTGSGGFLNASTWFDRTDYITTLPENHLERWLSIESSRMQHMTFDEKKFNDERFIVLRELGERRSRPFGDHVLERIFTNSFPDGHPYQILPIGSEKDLRAATLADAEQFYKTYYWPDNAVLIVSGDIDYESAEAQVKRWFSGLRPSPGAIPQRTAPPGPPSKPRDSMVDPHGRQPALALAWRVPGKYQPGYAETLLLARVLQNRLNESLVLEDEQAVGIDDYTFRLQRESLLTLTVIPRSRPGESESASLRRVEAALRAELARILDGGLDPQRLREQAGGLELGLRATLEDAQDSDLNAMMAECELMTGDPACFEQELSAIRSATPESALALARRYLTPKNETVLDVRTPGGR